MITGILMLSLSLLGAVLALLIARWGYKNDEAVAFPVALLIGLAAAGGIATGFERLQKWEDAQVERSRP